MAQITGKVRRLEARSEEFATNAVEARDVELAAAVNCVGHLVAVGLVPVRISPDIAASLGAKNEGLVRSLPV